ncbi:MAG: outer membrane beta-barrel protein [Rubrivivax sp.]|nr:outer membrane beta-barrel protein [Rubrivivax sp.]
MPSHELTPLRTLRAPAGAGTRAWVAAAARALAATALLAGAGAAWAQPAGSIVVRGAVTQIAPDVLSGDLSAPSFTGTRADIKSDTQPTAGITWAWTDNLSLDLPLSAGFKHDIVGDGAIAGVGKIGEVRALPITLLAQYRFFGASAELRPYVGLGPTYAKFYKARSTAALSGLTGGTPANPTTLSIESKWALTAQVGVGLRFAPKWSLDANITKTALKTRATLSTGQTLDATLDPWSYTVGVGYRF